jgi:hypothetical protein
MYDAILQQKAQIYFENQPFEVNSMAQTALPGVVKNLNGNFITNSIPLPALIPLFCRDCMTRPGAVRPGIGFHPQVLYTPVCVMRSFK